MVDICRLRLARPKTWTRSRGSLLYPRNTHRNTTLIAPVLDADMVSPVPEKYDWRVKIRRNPPIVQGQD